MAVEQWDRTFTTLDGYRGVNANMHTVEAYLAAADVTGDRVWLDRALRIVRARRARLGRGQLVAHPRALRLRLGAGPRLQRRHPGAPVPSLRRDDRPLARVGAADAARARRDHRRAATSPRPGCSTDAVALFDAAVREGWDVDGAPGFVYTVDWSGKPVVRERMHWVAAEAVAAAAALHAATGEQRFDDAYTQWWEYIGAHHLDRVGGSWWHELGTDNQVSRTVWAGKADLYHAVQATLIPRLPLTPVIVPALAAGLLD